MKLEILDSNHSCLAVIISMDSALKKDENCYPQVFLKGCKYIEKKVTRHILIKLIKNRLDQVNDF